MTKLVRCGINFYADVDNKKAVNDRDALQNTKLMEHYTHLLGQLQYEGAGIWSRFNIMFGINVSLFGLETVLFNSICQTSEYLTFIIAFGGLSFSIWSIYVMQRLWSYHEVSIRPRACFFPLFSFLPLWLHYNLNPLCVQY